MTFGQLLEALQRLSPEQLQQDAIWWGDERGGLIACLDVLEEDYVNFGEGCEPWSAYADDPDCSKEDADCVLPAGTPVLLDSEVCTTTPSLELVP